MATLKAIKKKSKGINLDALGKMLDDHKTINTLLAQGEKIDPILTKNFASFTLHRNPYRKLGL